MPRAARISFSLDSTLEQVTTAFVQAVLSDCHGNVSVAARRLGLYRRTLQRMRQKVGSRPEGNKMKEELTRKKVVACH